MVNRISCFIISLAILISLVPYAVSAQDYVMYETVYLKVMPGHGEAFTSAMSKHNKQYHNQGAHTGGVQYVINGSHTGELVWVMGPTTFTDLDSRPASDAHNNDWFNTVLSHCEKVDNTEYWRVNDNLSYVAESANDATDPLLLVRFFEVADDALFIKLQEQIKEVLKIQSPGRSRVMYRKQFLHNDGRDWATVTPYSSWSELDKETGDFADAYKKIYGENAWPKFLEEFGEAIISREDEWRQMVPGMDGTSN